MVLTATLTMTGCLICGNMSTWDGPLETAPLSSDSVFPAGPVNGTQTESPCDPVLMLGPGGCEFLTAEVDLDNFTDPFSNDTDGDGLNDSREALTLLTDPTAVDTDGDGILDGRSERELWGPSVGIRSTQQQYRRRPI